MTGIWRDLYYFSPSWVLRDCGQNPLFQNIKTLLWYYFTASYIFNPCFYGFPSESSPVCPYTSRILHNGIWKDGGGGRLFICWNQYFLSLLSWKYGLYCSWYITIIKAFSILKAGSLYYLPLFHSERLFWKFPQAPIINSNFQAKFSNGQPIPVGESFCQSCSLSFIALVSHGSLALRCARMYLKTTILILHCLILQPLFCSLKQARPFSALCHQEPQGSGILLFLAYCPFGTVKLAPPPALPNSFNRGQRVVQVDLTMASPWPELPYEM